MTAADRRRSPRTAPPGASRVKLVHGRIAAGGRLVDVSRSGARVRLDAETPNETVSSLREAVDADAVVYLVDDRAWPYRRMRIAWIGSLSEGGFALGLETAPDEAAWFETGPEAAPYLPMDLMLSRHGR